MRRIGRIFASLFRSAVPSAQDAAAIARRQHGPCLLCGEELLGHDITPIASVIVDAPESKRLAALDAAIRNRAWRDVAQFQEWRGDADEVVYSAIRCPWSCQFYLSRLESFASMDMDDQVTNRELLSEEQSAQLASQMGLEL